MTKKAIMERMAYHSGRSASEYNMQRVVPERWQKFTKEWCKGYDSMTEAKKILNRKE